MALAEDLSQYSGEGVGSKFGYGPDGPFDKPALERVADIADVIAEGGDMGQEQRKLDQSTVDQLVDHGFFRFTIPHELGGENASILETVEVLEAICAIDGSVGWNVMLGSEINAMAVGGMDETLAKEIYLDNPRVVMCGGGGAVVEPPRAEEQPDGSFKVWGAIAFVSGVHNAEWCFMPAPIVKDGEPVLDDAGNPKFKLWMMNKSEYEILDTWDVAGMRGSGSHTVRANGAVVPAKHAGVDLFVLPPKHDNPVYRVPVPLRLSYNKSATSLGVAKGAIQAFSDLAQNKIPALSSSSLANRPIAQHRMGECVAKYEAARAYMFDTLGAVEDELNAGAPVPGPETTKNARLACVFAANACMEVVDTLHNTAGTTGAFMANPLERKLRDARMSASHRWVSHSLYPEIGKSYLGLDPLPEFLGTDVAPIVDGAKKK